MILLHRTRGFDRVKVPVESLIMPPPAAQASVTAVTRAPEVVTSQIPHVWPLTCWERPIISKPDKKKFLTLIKNGFKRVVLFGVYTEYFVHKFSSKVPIRNSYELLPGLYGYVFGLNMFRVNELSPKGGISTNSARYVKTAKSLNNKFLSGFGWANDQIAIIQPWRHIWSPNYWSIRCCYCVNFLCPAIVNV